MVSIIMPAYNAEKTISESIESVIAQTFKNWELIIINDCSTDKTKEVINEYLKDERIIYLENEVNLGVAMTRNKGLDVAKFDYIAFLDSDDLWYKNKLKIQIAYMIEKNLSFTVTNYDVFVKDNDTRTKYIKSKTQNYKSLLRGSNIGCLTVILDKRKIKHLEFKNIGHEDYALWLKIMRENNVSAYSIDKIMSSYREVKGSLSSDKKKAVMWTYEIFRQEEKKNRIAAFYFIVRYIINVFIKNKKIKKRVESVWD